ALEGGAALVDIKEPANGPLGRADEPTIRAVVRAVAGRRPISAALGELVAQTTPYRGPGLAFVKWGLAGCRELPGWQQVLSVARAQVEQWNPTCQVVSVAYADWERAGAPPTNAVIAFACHWPGSVLLVDTFEKGDGRSLLDWLSLEELTRAC